MILPITVISRDEIPKFSASSISGRIQNFASPSDEYTWTCIRFSSREKKKKRYGPSRKMVGLTRKIVQQSVTLALFGTAVVLAVLHWKRR